MGSGALVCRALTAELDATRCGGIASVHLDLDPGATQRAISASASATTPDSTYPSPWNPAVPRGFARDRVQELRNPRAFVPFELVPPAGRLR